MAISVVGHLDLAAVDTDQPVFRVILVCFPGNGGRAPITESFLNARPAVGGIRVACKLGQEWERHGHHQLGQAIARGAGLALTG